MLNVYGVGGSEGISKDMTAPFFSSNFKQPSSFEGELAKTKDLAGFDLYSYAQQQQGSGLLRYRSAPSTFFANLMDGTCFEDFLNHTSPPPTTTTSDEPETMFSGFMFCNDSVNLDSQSMNEIDRRNPQFLTPAKQEAEEAVPNMGAPRQNGFSAAAPPMMSYGAPVSSASTVGSYSMAMDNNPSQLRMNNGNLVRQSSSPPEFFSGFSVTGNVRNYGSAGNGINGDTRSSTGKLNNQMSFSSGPPSHSRFMPRIAENGTENCRTGPSGNGDLGNSNNSNYRSGVPCFQDDSWNESPCAGFKRNRDGDLKVFSTNGLDSQNGNSKNYSPASLTHHLSLPKTSAEMAVVEKFLQFQQDSVPCKIRAKRGCATHPRSIAERVRRTKISEKMRKLQDLFPNIDKQTNTADMLDMAIDYIKDLQKQVQKLTDTKAKCTCSGKHQTTLKG